MTDQDFLMPDLGEGLTEGTVVRWLVAEGDSIEIDQAIAEIETAKAVVDVPSPYAGRVAILHGGVGDVIAVGTPLISVRPEGDDSFVIAPPQGAPISNSASHAASAAAQTYREEERAGSGNVLIGYGTGEPQSVGRQRRRRAHANSNDSSPPAIDAPRDMSLPRSALAANPDVEPAFSELVRRYDGNATSQGTAPLVTSPVVRRLARDHQLNIATLKGTGQDGLITRTDVENAIAERVESPSTLQQSAESAARSAVSAPSPSPLSQSMQPQVATPRHAGKTNSRTGLQELSREPISGFRKLVGETLSRSRTEIPEATVWVDVDATPLVELREALRASGGPGLLSLVARFVVAGLMKYPALNGFLDTDRNELVEYAGVNLGLAVQSDRGLVVPAVLNAHLMTTRELDAEIKRLTESALVGKATPQELTAGTFTLNNFGGFNVDGSAAIINHPQVAILGLGRIIDKPWVVEGQIAIRKMTQLSFVFDHRVCDGGVASGFIRFVADAIENPARIIADL
ncbi:MAG: dihydrolipoamide acetyltransferase family protein [Antricoccus sp.]